MNQKINLTLPKQWNACTTEQLELIANVIREQVERQDRYHPFSMQNVKIALFFALTGIEIVEGPNPRVPVEEQYYTCRFTARPKWKSFLPSFFGGGVGGEDNFSLYLWQINYWVNGSPLDRKGNLKTPSHKGEGGGGALLDWLDNESGSFLTKFPYPIIKRRRRSRWLSIGRKCVFHGPLKDLDGFSWAQYRLASDAMQSYVALGNNLAKMQKMATFSLEQLHTQERSVETAKSMFLATIFNASVNHIDTTTGMVRKDFHYESNQITDNLEYFRNFPDTQWQVILFWWTGLMHSLSKRYPHVFKVQKVEKKRTPSSAMEIYTATIATMQKYVGINEKECNNQSYSIVLEQLERIAKESEELERIQRKK